MSHKTTGTQQMEGKAINTKLPATSEVRALAVNDVLNLADLRLSQDFERQIGVKQIITSVAVRKPDRMWWNRVHPDPTCRMSAAILEVREEKQTFLVAPPLIGELPGLVYPAMLFTSINMQGSLFIWPIRLPNADGRQNPWHSSALAGAQAAMKNWVRIAANMSAGRYDVFEANVKYPEPEWPDRSFEELLKIAFQNNFIRSLDHPVVQRLLGNR